jgi:hypothetical protein
MDWLAQLNAPTAAMTVLTAMITPAVLISACGSLILSTSTRLGRVVDRVRVLSDRFEELAGKKAEVVLYEERRAMIFDQLDKLTSRARLLQRSLTLHYAALGVFVSTSVAIAIVAAEWTRAYGVPVMLGLGGAVLLLWGSTLLILEARLAHKMVHAEMDFLWRLGQHHAGEDLVQRQRTRLPFGRRRASDAR